MELLRTLLSRTLGLGGDKPEPVLDELSLQGVSRFLKSDRCRDTGNTGNGDGNGDPPRTGRGQREDQAWRGDDGNGGDTGTPGTAGQREWGKGGRSGNGVHLGLHSARGKGQFWGSRGQIWGSPLCPPPR